MLDTLHTTFDLGSDDASTTTAAPLRPSRAQAEEAVRTLIRWAGDRADREGLLQTPARVVRAASGLMRSTRAFPASMSTPASR